MPWLTTQDVAHKLGVTTRTVERWRINGVLVPIRRTSGNHSRYSEKQICRFKQNKELEQLIS